MISKEARKYEVKMDKSLEPPTPVENVDKLDKKTKNSVHVVEDYQ